MEVECTNHNCNQIIDRKPSEIKRSTNQFCSRECKHEYDREGKYVTCNTCGTEEYRQPKYINESGNHFCSNECHGKFLRDRIEAECETCGTTFGKKRSQYELTDNHYCSAECQNEGQKKRITTSCTNCGEEIKRVPADIEEFENHFCNSTCKYEYESGENHHRYRGGTTDFYRSTEGIEWRETVFERDNYTCQDCGDRGGNLNAHHIEPKSESPEKKDDKDNGVTLCIPCHANRHEGEKAEKLILSHL